MKAYFSKLSTVFVMALGLSFSANADETNAELKAVNDIVEQKAQKLDREYGLLMDTIERENYKIKVIASKQRDKQALNPHLSTSDLVNDGVEVYELGDYEKRQLIIELEPMTHGSGYEPPK